MKPPPSDPNTTSNLRKRARSRSPTSVDITRVLATFKPDDIIVWSYRVSGNQRITYQRLGRFQQVENGVATVLTNQRRSSAAKDHARNWGDWELLRDDDGDPVLEEQQLPPPTNTFEIFDVRLAERFSGEIWIGAPPQLTSVSPCRARFISELSAATDHPPAMHVTEPSARELSPAAKRRPTATKRPRSNLEPLSRDDVARALLLLRPGNLCNVDNTFRCFAHLAACW